MGPASNDEPAHPWEPVADPEGRFSSGIPDLDRLLGGGFACGSFALFQVDETVGPSDLRMLLAPTILNFLAQSRGLLAVLPARESPSEFRRAMLPWVSRRLFDSRVRIVEYAGEDSELPYVVSLHPLPERAKGIQRMVEAEQAVAGRRGRPIIELNAFEVLETVVGAEKAQKMFFFGIKRSRSVGNLGLGILRPGLECADGIRSMVDSEFALHRSAVGLQLTGLRPTFGPHLVVADRRRGAPHAELIPPP